MPKPFIVGITGGSASGKTTILRQLVAAFDPATICLLSQDNYYFPRESQPTDENGVINFDLPVCIDAAAFAHDVAQLSQGRPVTRREYVFNNPAIIPRDLIFQPAPIVVVEGIFVFYFAEVARHLDLRVYIDAEEHVKLHRRIVRDAEERGYDLDDVLYRYTHHVAPTYDRYIRPFRFDADLIIPNNRRYEKGLAVLISFLQAKI